MKDYKKPLLEVTSFENGQAVMLVSGNFNEDNIVRKNKDTIKRKQLDAN
jgi:hypothetical protein